MIYRICHLIAVVLFKVAYRRQVIGLENRPDRGPFMICSNHISWFDPASVASVFPGRLKIQFMAKKELFSNLVSAFFLKKLGAFPVNREAADYKAFRKALQIADEGGVLGLFPEGTRSKDGKLQSAQHGAALIAQRCKIPIVPVAVVGPYRIGHRLKIVIGPPFDLSNLEYAGMVQKKDRLKIMSEEIMQRIKNLILSADNNSQD